jgi:hypothetical protein
MAGGFGSTDLSTLKPVSNMAKCDVQREVPHAWTERKRGQTRAPLDMILDTARTRTSPEGFTGTPVSDSESASHRFQEFLPNEGKRLKIFPVRFLALRRVARRHDCSQR